MSDSLKKVELLAPAGSYESAVAAIQNGCDALYMAGMRFGARASATNFDDEKLKEIVRYAHAYGVKVYITLNTLLHDEELEECLAYVDFLYTINVDALIIQDLGLLYEVRSKYPDFEIHASTQMHITNKEALLFLKHLGVKRAVLARETPLTEIRELAKLGIELEVFVHGALCVAYSGQCLMSAMVGGRSGNRGECAQTCRMPYSLIDINKNKTVHEQAYLLSLKDLNTLEHMQALIEAGVTSFKIEGRMKKSEYVGHITRLYRKQIDDVHASVSDDDLEQAKVLFHRGYTSGFLYEQKGTHLYNLYRPNHLGITVGNVLAYDRPKVKVKLTHALNQHDGIRILQAKTDYGFKVNRLYVNGKLANHAPSGSVVEIECYEPVAKNSVVVKTSDPLVEKNIREQYEKGIRKVNVNMSVEAKANAVLTLIVEDGIHKVCVHSEEVIEHALQRATTNEEIEKQCRKMNDTIFSLEKITITMKEDLFIPIKIMNALRRNALHLLYELRADDMHRVKIPFNSKQAIVKRANQQLCVSVLNEEQLLACLHEVDAIYVRDYTLYEKYKEYAHVYRSSDRVNKEGYTDLRVVHDIGGLYEGKEVICDSGLNVYNASTCYFLSCCNVEKITFSHELNTQEIRTCIQNYKQKYNTLPNTEVVVYGRVEVMVSEHCPINACLLDNDKKGCTLCRHATYALKDKFQNEYPMHNDAYCRMHLYDCKVMNQIKKANEYYQMGVQSLRLQFTFESEEEVLEVIKKVKKAINS